MLRKISALIKKNFLIEASYKLAFISNILSIFVTVLIYFFIDKLFGYKVTRHLEEFGVNYFSYVLLSMAFFSYIGAGIGSFSGRIRSEQMQGTLEALLLTPAKVSILLLGLGLWNFIFATLYVAIYVLLGAFLFGINFSNVNAASAIVILILTIISLSSLGIISASFVLVLKRGNPAAWIINNLEGLLGGVYFPVAVMPDALQFLAKFFPITYAIRGIELAVYRGYTLAQLKNEWGFLLLFSLALFPLSLSSFEYALRKVRLHGSLIQY